MGYRRLMAVDEAGTRARRKADLGDVIAPRIAEYGGRIVKTAGDGLLGEFSSVVDALRGERSTRPGPIKSRHDGVRCDDRHSLHAGARATVTPARVTAAVRPGKAGSKAS